MCLVTLVSLVHVICVFYLLGGCCFRAFISLSLLIVLGEIPMAFPIAYDEDERERNESEKLTNTHTHTHTHTKTGHWVTTSFIVNQTL